VKSENTSGNDKNQRQEKKGNHCASELEQRAYIFEAMFEQAEPHLFAYLMQWAAIEPRAAY